MSRRRARVVPTAPPKTAIGYLRVSTREQADEGAGLDAQRSAIEAWALVNGVTIVEWRVDKSSGKSMTKRKGLHLAFEDVHSQRAETIVVAKLDRLSRSIIDFTMILADAKQNNWNVVAIDLGLDMTTPTGKFMAQVLALFAEWERELISIRTKEGLAEKRAQGVRLGRKRQVSDKILAKIISWRNVECMTYGQIATRLNQKGVPTAQGGLRWYPSTVHAVVSSQDGLALATV